MDLSHAKVSAALKTWICLRSVRSKTDIIVQMDKHLNDHYILLSFSKKRTEGSMHNLHENGLFGRTSHVHIISIGGRS